MKSKNFLDASNREMSLLLDFLEEVLFNLNGFEVWECENTFSDEDSDKWTEEVVERYKILIEEKEKLEDKLFDVREIEESVE